MAFDYYDRITKDMGTAAINAATAAATQLTALCTGSTNAEAMPPVLTIGVTLMPGIDDYPRKTEITYVKDAKAVLAFARVNSITTLSIWAIQRDNSGVPGDRWFKPLPRHRPEHLGVQPDLAGVHELTSTEATRQTWLGNAPFGRTRCEEAHPGEIIGVPAERSDGPSRRTHSAAPQADDVSST